MAEATRYASNNERVALFESSRSRLLGIAYRMLSTVTDAEEIVQEAWLRFQSVDVTELRQPSAWLTTVVTRLAIDRLRSARRLRERYVGPWLPEPLATVEASDPEYIAELHDSLTFGFLILLDRLGPYERAVFVLYEAFNMSYLEISLIVNRSESTCRQIASRARRKLLKVWEPRSRTEQAQSTVEALLIAVGAGDIDKVVACLAPDVVLAADGGPNVRAARRPVLGPKRVARWLVNVAARQRPETQIKLGEINGELGIVASFEGRVYFAMLFSVLEFGVSSIWVVNNPDKLFWIDKPAQLQ